MLLNNGDGTFAPKMEYPVGVGSRSVAIADVIGDGWPDLVVVNYIDNTVSVLLNQCE